MDDTEAFNNQLKESLESPDIQRIYANGFINAVGNGDVVIVLKNNDKPIATLNLSYTVAKTLSKKLGTTISLLEKNTGNSIMTTDQIEKAMTEGDIK